MRDSALFNFETQDGCCGLNLNKDHDDFIRQDFNPFDLKKIEVFTNPSYISGFNLLDYQDRALISQVTNHDD